MGNRCSSRLKKRKDNLSENSDDSPKYQLTAKSKHCDENLVTLESCNEQVTYDITELVEKSSKDEDAENVHGSKTNYPNALPEFLSNLTILHGKIPMNKEREKKIVIYVLSDDNIEYNYHKSIIYSLYNYLETKCSLNGFELFISELQDWQFIEKKELLKIKYIDNSKSSLGTESEGAANYFSKIYRNFSSAYVIPILFLGSSMGIPMLPLTVECHDFKSMLSSANTDDTNLLQMWYTKDKDDPVCYRLDTKHMESASAETTKQLHNLLNTLLKLSSEDQKNLYITTVVEQEINNVVLKNKEITMRCICIKIEDKYLKASQYATPFEMELIRRSSKIYSQIKGHLSDKNIITTCPSANISDEKFVSVIKNLLDNFITSILKENGNAFSHNTNGINVELLKEIQLVNSYSKILYQTAPNFEIMKEIKRYIENNSEYPLIISGCAGIGKSVLVSKLIEDIFKWKSEIHLIVRYADLSDSSSDITTLLGSVANQLSVFINGFHCHIEHTVKNYAVTIQNLLETCSLFVVVIIDSVDEIMNGNNFDWIQIQAKGSYKIILTVAEFEEKSTSEELFNYRIPKENFLQLNKLNKNQCENIFFSIKADFSVSHVHSQISENFSIFNGKTPFHAKALWWLAWLDNISIKNANISEIFEEIFITLESRLSTEKLSALLLIISLSKWGIREYDCKAVFRNIAHADVQESCRIWSKFCWIMGPMLLYLTNVRIADKIFRDAIIKRYETKKELVHSSIVDYFEKQPSTFTSSNGAAATYNHQKFLKQPYHYLCTLGSSCNKIKLAQFYNSSYFTDICWIYNKVIATGPVPMLLDIIRANNILANCNVSCIHIDILEKFLKKYFNELNYDGKQFLTLLKFFLKVKEDINVSNYNNVILTWFTSIQKMKSTYLEIINKKFQDPTCHSLRGYDILVYLPDKPFHVASLSTQREEICIWNVQTCERVREFRGIPFPTAICPIGKSEAAVLCKRQIMVMNLNDGKFKITLKGVLNQKMPYFGQHDENHVVCLSRNRMYVNLMNLETGDCVATFKAGEDRFLNSLLISGDGRILVCGDETQKPFPLLVWHLSQRKLLYDLRIPNHDFLTNLSAITYEGAYICVVAIELDETGPNFTVVYDLQSGTLFKKLKTTCNTVSLAISQVNVCVIAGLENANIIIWDLVTGNCRTKLEGHNAPVTFLKLDSFGKILLSHNKEGRDYSLRLWDLISGKLLAVYTPPGQISNCEILPNGKFIVISVKNLPNIIFLTLKNYCETTNEKYRNEEDQF